MKISLHKSVLFDCMVCLAVMGLVQASPEDTVIVWDLNGVILKSDWRAMLAKAFSCKHKWSILKNAGATISCLMNRSGEQERSCEYIIRSCDCCNPEFAHLMRSMSGCQNLVPEVVAIVERLHARGYTQLIATNMGIKTVESLRKKYTSFFANFSSVTTSDTVSMNGEFIPKPTAKFFSLLKKRPECEGKRIIFIDDDWDNVNAAQQAGIMAVRFEGHNQLKSNLAVFDF